MSKYILRPGIYAMLFSEGLQTLTEPPIHPHRLPGSSGSFSSMALVGAQEPQGGRLTHVTELLLLLSRETSSGSVADSAPHLHRWETEAGQKSSLVVPPLVAVCRGRGARKGLGSRRHSGGMLLSYASRWLLRLRAEVCGGSCRPAGAAVPPCIQTGVLKDAGLHRQDGCCGLWAVSPGSGLCHLVAPAGPTPGTAPSGGPWAAGWLPPHLPSHLCFPPHTRGPADPARVLNMPPVIYVPVGIHGYIRCPVDAEPPATVVKWNKDGRPLQVEKVPEGRVPVAGGPPALRCYLWGSGSCQGPSPPPRIWGEQRAVSRGPSPAGPGRSRIARCPPPPPTSSLHTEEQLRSS